MHELLEIILEDLHHMHSRGELEGPQLQLILDMVEKREYEYDQLIEDRILEDREGDWIGSINKAMKKLRNE